MWPMAIVCRDQRLLFVMAPRTACSAIGWVLREQLGGEWLPESAINDQRGRTLVVRKHTTLEELMTNGVLSAEERARMLVFTTVRNPFDSLVSLYVKNAVELPSRWHKQGRDGRESKIDDVRFCSTHTFDEWIDHCYATRLRDLIRMRPVRRGRIRHASGVDVVMRFENLQGDFDDVLRQVGITDEHRIPVLNRTTERKRDWRSYYSPRSRRLVERAWKEDLNRFGYSFDPVAPPRG
jgi:hypothetical protein